MIHAGIGETHLNALLTTIGLPSISNKTLKKRERNIGPHIERTANESCSSACEQEKLLTLQCNTTDSTEIHEDDEQITFEEALALLDDDIGDEVQIPEKENTQPAIPSNHEHKDVQNETPHQVLLDAADTTDLVDVTVSQDAAWSRRTRGMNSLSGWGHAIGHQTKRCLSFSTRIKKCKKCSTYGRMGKPVPQHDCRVNWSGSAKAMEADIAVQLHQEAPTQGIKYKAVIGDEDSSAIKHIRERVNSDIEKYSDIGHIKRNLSYKLEALHKQHKCLSANVRNDFVKNFTYAYHQNNTKSEEAMRDSLTNIVPHMYGEHENCGTWCNYSKVDNYKHKTLPYGKDLTDLSLKHALEKLLNPFIEHPNKLLTTGNSQANESLNNTAWSRAPKCRNYKLSESFDYRCAAAVSQFNNGKQYIEKVCTTANLTPQKMSNAFNVKLDKRRDYQKGYKRERNNKRRRIELKKERSTQEVLYTVKEGTTYKKNCLLDDETIDTIIIDDPSIHQQIKPEACETVNIFFDLETTKLGNDAEITQLSAYTRENKMFNAYVIPKGDISTAAANITGLQINVQDGKRVMLKDGQILESCPLKEAIQDFINWMDTFGKTYLVLIAHNLNAFDMPLLVRDVVACGLLDEMRATVFGFCDSLPLLRKLLPGRRSYTLSSLHEDVVKTPFSNHDASADVKALSDIFLNIGITQETINNEMLPFSNALTMLRRRFPYVPHVNN